MMIMIWLTERSIPVCVAVTAHCNRNVPKYHFDDTNDSQRDQHHRFIIMILLFVLMAPRFQWVYDFLWLINSLTQLGMGLKSSKNDKRNCCMRNSQLSVVHSTFTDNVLRNNVIRKWFCRMRNRFSHAHILYTRRNQTPLQMTMMMTMCEANAIRNWTSWFRIIVIVFRVSVCVNRKFCVRDSP